MCKEYPALSPYDVDETPYGRVIDLYCDMRKMQIASKKNVNPQGATVIRRKAGDDWF